MDTTQQVFSCFGCGTESTGLLPFVCSQTDHLAGYDHVLRRRLDLDPAHRRAALEAFDTEPGNPFITFRWLSAPYHMALARGWSDQRYVDLVNRLDDSIAELVGTGFRATPTRRCNELSSAVGCHLWIKDETRNVAGSHKGRHLMGVMLWLQILHEDGALAKVRRPGEVSLAIASCGNAAMAAGVIAAAGGMDLDVFIPVNASRSVVDRLSQLGARLHTCIREPGTLGDPCVRAFKAAVEGGALPFTCQGNENGLTVDGGETLAFEIVAALRKKERVALDRLVVQVGGGALASSLVQGLQRCLELGLIAEIPRICPVQTTGCHPLHEAWQRVVHGLVSVDHRTSPEAIAERIRAAYSIAELEHTTHLIAQRRDHYMTPWKEEPKSLADGILDDETYDWLAIVDAMLKTGGFPTLVEDRVVLSANELARETTKIPVGTTGSAGFAGCLELARHGRLGADEHVEVLFTGVERDREQEGA